MFWSKRNDTEIWSPNFESMYVGSIHSSVILIPTKQSITVHTHTSPTVHVIGSLHDQLEVTRSSYLRIAPISTIDSLFGKGMKNVCGITNIAHIFHAFTNAALVGLAKIPRAFARRAAILGPSRQVFISQNPVIRQQ